MRIPEGSGPAFSRRGVMLAAPFVLVAAFSRAKGEEPEPEVTIVEFTDAGKRIGEARVKKVAHTEAEWRKLLTLQQFYVTRKGNSDLHHYGTYFKLHDAGIYRCVACANAVFSSDAKFDSPSGFASFRAPIAEENVYTHVDPAELPKVDGVYCKRCDSHLGALYHDGPEPAKTRYSISESALHFVPLAKK